MGNVEMYISFLKSISLFFAKYILFIFKKLTNFLCKKK